MNNKHTTRREVKKILSVTVDDLVKQYFNRIPKRNRSGLANEVLLRYIQRQKQRARRERQLQKAVTA